MSRRVLRMALAIWFRQIVFTENGDVGKPLAGAVSRRRCCQNFLDALTYILHVSFGKGRMHEKHQACFGEFRCDWHTLRRPELFGKGFFEIDLATDTAVARNTLGVYGVQDSVPIPSFSQTPRAQENVTFVIGVADFIRWSRDA